MPKFSKVAVVTFSGAVLGICMLCGICGLVSQITGGETTPTPAVARLAEIADFSTPTITPVPPTATNIPPTATQIPPTATPPPTDTPSPPPTDTAITEEPTVATINASTGLQNLEAAQVVKVVDGDTINVAISGAEYKVRYILIDTPETKHPTKGVQPFGPEASEANRQMVEDQTVYLEKDVSETDRYGRLLRYVYVADGRMVNEELLRMGLAQVSTYPPDVKYVDRFLAVQSEARTAGVGLWGDIQIEPTPPPASNGEAAQDATVIIVEVNKKLEYVDIENIGSAAQDLTNWHLLSEKGNQDCLLSGVIQPGEQVRILARADDTQTGINCGYAKSIWNNSKPDAAVLINPDGVEVDRK